MRYDEKFKYTSEIQTDALSYFESMAAHNIISQTQFFWTNK